MKNSIAKKVSSVTNQMIRDEKARNVHLEGNRGRTLLLRWFSMNFRHVISMISFEFSLFGTKLSSQPVLIQSVFIGHYSFDFSQSLSAICQVERWLRNIEDEKERLVMTEKLMKLVRFGLMSGKNLCQVMCIQAFTICNCV